jgi:hypothetical protein
LSAPADVDADATGPIPNAPPGRAASRRADPERAVAWAAAVLVILQLTVRGWTAAGGWLARQDFLAGAGAAGLPVHPSGPPGSVALARVVASVTPLSWPALVGLEILGQGLIDLALYRLLVELFGRRPAVLLPLTVYLTSSLPLMGGVWWSAALVELPLQLLLLVAVTGHVRHLRTHDPRPALLGALAVAVGLLFGAEAALVPVLLFAGTLLWATDGPLRARLRMTVRLPLVWPVQAVAVAAGVAARLLLPGGPLLPSGLADGVRALPGMLSRTVLPGLVGGPWTWRTVAAPLVVAAPPRAVLWGAPAALTVVVLAALLMHRGAARAWVVAAVAGAAVLLARGPVLADGTGQLPADVVPPASLALLAALCVGLSFLPVVDSPAVLRRRRWATTGALRWVPARLGSRPVGVAVAVALAAGWLTTTAGFAQHWSVNAARGYVAEARASVVGHPELVLADTTVPEDVVPSSLAPANTAAVVLSGLPGLPQFLHDGQVTSQLITLDEHGRGELAYVDAGSRSRPGPVADCGWLVGPDPADVRLPRATVDGRWIVQLSYYAGEGNVLHVRAGDTTGAALVGSGVHDVYLQVRGRVDHVVVTVDDPAKPICLGAVTVGRPRALPAGGR